LLLGAFFSQLTIRYCLRLQVRFTFGVNLGRRETLEFVRFLQVLSDHLHGHPNPENAK
jgi:hypothetical protein